MAVSKETLLNRVWPDVVVEESNLAQAVFALRKALGDDPVHPAFIATVPRYGYRFVANVVERENGTDHVPSLPKHSPNWRIVGALLTVVVLAAATTAFVVRRHAAATLKSVAVLPFRLVDSPEAQHLADGVAEALTARLAQLRPLVVIPSATVREYLARKKQTADAEPSPEMAHDLGVEALLTGSVHESAGRLVVNAILVDGQSGRQRWMERFDVTASDLFGVVGRIATAVALNLGVSADASQPALTRRPPPNPDAYDFYLRGRKIFGPAVGAEFREARERAGEWYQKAIQIDPTLAEAYDGLAAVEYGRFSQGWNSGAEALSRSQKFAEQAILLDPTIADSYVTLIVINWTLGQSEAGLQVGRRVEAAGLTDIAGLRARANAYHFAGLGEKAVALMSRVVALDPASSDAQHRYVGTLITAHRYKEAIAEAERYFKRFPDLARTHHLAGLAHWSAGDLAAARREMEIARRLAPTDMVVGLNFSRLLWVIGDKAEAQRVAEADVKAMERMAAAYPDNFLTQAHLAQQYGILGRETAVREQEGNVMRLAARNGSVTSQIGMAYANLGDFDRAIAIWNQALEDGFTAWDGPGDLVARYPALANSSAYQVFRRALDAELARLGREY